MTASTDQACCPACTAPLADGLCESCSCMTCGGILLHEPGCAALARQRKRLGIGEENGR